MRKTFFLVLILAVIGTGLYFIPNYDSVEESSLSPALIEKFVHVEKIHLTDFASNRFFLVSNSQSYSQIEISNEIKNTVLRLQLSCDQDFYQGLSHFTLDINGRSFPTSSIQNFRFQLNSNQTTSFLLDKNIKNCELSYVDAVTLSQKGNLQLRSESAEIPWLTELINHKEECAGNGLKLPQLTCAHQAQDIETLPTPESGFIAKVEMLLGQKLDPSFITNQNPYAPLDFSKAPKLRGIFLASLVYRADFYGTVMARLLKFHAERGTPVHLITTGYMMLDKDKTLLYNLSKNGNIRLQEFTYYDPKHNLSRPLRYIDNKFRDMHIKLLITLADEAKYNAVVLGGRNIHDGFLFRTKPDYSRYPELVQYGTDDDFVHWNDFELKITSKEMAKVTAAHLMRFWNRDTMTEWLSDIYASGAEKSQKAEGAQFRHFISLPYNDGKALEQLYVSLIDNAKSKILISSPYLRPTEKIMEALKRAAARKVDITIQTRVSLEGDTQAWLYEEVNKESINALYDRVKIYEWKQNSILHSKFILVDGEIAFLGSVNLSRRSFVQDVENGYVIKDKNFVQKMENIFHSYIEKSALITEPQVRKVLPSALIKVLQDQF